VPVGVGKLFPSQKAAFRPEHRQQVVEAHFMNERCAVRLCASGTADYHKSVLSLLGGIWRITENRPAIISVV